MERPIALENASTYLEFSTSTWPESEFLADWRPEADCGILLDVNNVYVSSFNHGFDPKQYIDRIPRDRVVQMHLAGHTHKGTHILDTHSDYVIDTVWDLYRHAHQQAGRRRDAAGMGREYSQFRRSAWRGTEGAPVPRAGRRAAGG